MPRKSDTKTAAKPSAKRTRKPAAKPAPKKTTSKAPVAGKRGRPPLPKIDAGTPNPAAIAIRKLRKDSGLSLEEFGAKVGMAGTAIARLERDDYYSVTLSTLLTIADKLGVKVSLSFRKK